METTEEKAVEHKNKIDISDKGNLMEDTLDEGNWNIQIINIDDSDDSGANT